MIIHKLGLSFLAMICYNRMTGIMQLYRFDENFDRAGLLA